MDPFEMMFVPMVLFMVLVAPVWIVMHYRSLNRSSRSLSIEDRAALDEMLATVDKLSERIVSLESILDADHPEWRRGDADGSRGN
jgi:phage shock protein B